MKMRLEEKTIKMLSESKIDFGANVIYADSDFTKEQIDELRELICDEFISRGLEQNDEPNSYGKFLESLIDELGHYL